MSFGRDILRVVFLTYMLLTIYTICPPPAGGGAVLTYKSLMGMCHWMGSHFHDWIGYNGVAFSIELLEWAHTFSDFWGKTVLHIYG